MKNTYTIHSGTKYRIKYIFRCEVCQKSFTGIYFIGVSTVYYFLMHDQQQRQQIEKMKQQELKASLLDQEIKSELVLTQMPFLELKLIHTF